MTLFFLFTKHFKINLSVAIVIFSSLLFSVIKIVPELVQKTQAFIIPKNLFQNHKVYCKMKPFKL